MRIGATKRLLAAALVTACVAGASSAHADDVNDPANCPYCRGDRGALELAGLRSHGGFRFAKLDTVAIDEFFPDLTIYWIETEHFEIGLALAPHKVTQREKKKIRAELARLKEVLPQVPSKPRVLDPWLRLHLYAQRFEDTYAKFLEVMQVTQDRFPTADSPGWTPGTPYYGEGPYVGQKGKFEALVLPNAQQQVLFLRDQFGLSVRHTQKWNVIEHDTLVFVANLTQDNIRGDENLHNHLVFNVVHQLVDGYKHYSYDTPLWLKEGLAHWFEREITPEYNTFSFSEGGIPDEIRKADWDGAVKKLIARGDAPRIAELVALDGFAEFEARHHLACWSLTAFLIERYPEAFARLHGDLHGRKNAEGYPDGSDLRDAHREAVRTHFGKSYAQLDAEWRTWAEAR